MKSFQLFILLVFLIYPFVGAQAKHPGDISNNPGAQPATTIGSLNIGDSLPADILLNLLNYKNKTARISDFNKKLLIIDFWATWCTSCIRGFNKLEILQAQFGDDLRVLLVNTYTTLDDEKKVAAYFQKREQQTTKPFPFPTIVRDTLFNDLFPHTSLPHYIWIKEGLVTAITGSDQLTVTNMRNILNGRPAVMINKKDQDADRPLFVNASMPEDKLLSYSILLKGRFDGLGTGNRLRRSGDTIHGHAMINQPLMYMYKMAAGKLLPGFNNKRMIIRISDTSLLFPPADPAAKAAWQAANLYNYDLIVSPVKADSLYYFMLSDLNRGSSFNGRIESCFIETWVLQATGNISKLKSAKGPKKNNLYDTENPFLQNGSMADVLAFLNSLSFFTAPVINETGILETFNARLPAGINDIEKLKKALLPYGLQLTKQPRWLAMFVLTQKE